MSTPTSFILGVALDPTPEVPVSEVLETQVGAARTLDSGGFDFVTLDDNFHGATFDALLSASFISTRTRQIGLVPTVTTTHTEPFHVATATATLDYSGRARAGWAVAPSLTTEEAAAFGRREAASPTLAWAESIQVAGLVRALWDSWEDDAEIRDARSGRFLDREKVHYIDAVLTDSIAQPYTVKGPSIVPRPPQGHPPVFITVTDADSRHAALAVADVIILPASSVDEALDSIGATRAELAGRSALIIPSLAIPESGAAAWLRTTAEELIDAGTEGLHLRPGALRTDVDTIVAEVVDSAGRYGIHRQSTDLRSRLGLPEAVNQFAAP
ncbi:LLM class flavin-dependent oxidoreductase [Corynebacterium pacaense]|uniref:LLM class flavin-dependent oxidoreductase n=1 Tax=Corynebacterium pacaense TaxID=1816684 RepID=UPI0009BA1195|nr:LLM class flavin-dependent oxidoreductase [Corynebacterium pacaense]